MCLLIGSLPSSENRYSLIVGKLASQKIETVPIGTLKHHPKNPRKGDVKSITESIEHNGFYGVVVAQKSTGYVLAGNHRMMAAKAAGLDSLPVAYVDVDDATALKILLADNRTNDLATYDNKELAELLADVSNTIGLDGTGFDEAFLDGLIGELAQETPAGNADDVPEAQISKADELREKWQTELGQLWEVGRHRILCGDSTDETQVARLMDGKKADMVFTDPPYGVDYSGGIQFTNDGVQKENRKKLENDDSDLIYRRIVPVIAKWCDGAVYTWFAGTKGAKLFQAVEEHGEAHAMIIWVKAGGYSNLNANYKERKEPCLYWKPKGKSLKFIGETTESTVWEIAKDGKNEFHPTQKPIELALKAIQNHDAPKVLDLFLGGGSTILACEIANRVGYGMELDPAYVAVILERLSEMGLEPRLID